MSLNRSMCGFFKGTAWDPRSFFHRLSPQWFLQLKVLGTYLPGTGNMSWVTGVEQGLLTPKISLLNFYPPHVVVESAVPRFHTSTFHTSLDGCGLFNSIVGTSIQLDF